MAEQKDLYPCCFCISQSHWVAPSRSLLSGSHRPPNSSPRPAGPESVPVSAALSVPQAHLESNRHCWLSECLFSPPAESQSEAYHSETQGESHLTPSLQPSSHHLVGLGCLCCPSSNSHFRWLWSHILFCGRNCLTLPAEYQKTIGFSKHKQKAFAKRAAAEGTSAINGGLGIAPTSRVWQSG